MARFNISLVVLVLSVGVGQVHGTPMPGSLNPAFGANGKLYVDTSTFTNSPHYDVAALPDGRFVVAGDSFISGVSNVMGVGRFRVDGAFDSTFSNDGRAYVSVGESSDTHAIAVQDDGKVILGGYATIGGVSQIALARFNMDGSLDVSFAGDGVSTISFGQSASAYALAVQPDGQIVTGGYTRDASGNYDLALARLKSDGSLDASFGVGGLVTTPVGTRKYWIQDIAVLPDNRLIAVGDRPGAGTGWPTDSFIAAYRSDGSLDSSFSDDGILLTQLGGRVANFDGVALQDDGKVVVGGGFILNSSFDFGTARFLPDGSLDTSFGGGDGIATADFGGLDVARDLILQADGKVVLGGSQWTSGFQWAIARFTRNGELDTTFDADGQITLSMATSNGSVAIQSMALEPSGRLLAGGHAYTTASRFDFAAVDMYLVPEPSSMWLAGISVLGSIVFRFHRRHRDP